MERRQPPLEPFMAGDGFDIYIDGCRFLPDSVTFTRVSTAERKAYRTDRVQQNAESVRHNLENVSEQRECEKMLSVAGERECA